MGMRIWHQSFTVLEALPAYRAAIEQHLQVVVREGTEVVLHGQKSGTYPGNYPGDDLVYSYLNQMHGQQWVAGALAAQRQGFDAYAMCTLMDPWIREIRTLVDFPVIGYGEACFHLASLYGKRFGVLLFMDATAPLYRENIERYGLGSNCAGIGASGIAFADVVAAFQDPAQVIAQFSESVRRFVRETGADVIIPGELPMSMLLARNGINRIDDVPVLDGLAVTLKLTELAVDLKRLTGVTHSRRGFFNAAPRPERVLEVLRFYGADRLDGMP